MSELPMLSWSVQYNCGNLTTLWPTWRDYNVCLEESKLFYITEGEIVIRIKGEETVCRKGDIVLIPAGLKHDFYLSPLGRGSKYWFHFSLCCAGASVFDRYRLPLRFHTEKSEVKTLFEDAIAPIKSESDALRQVSAISRLAAYYIETAGKKIEAEDGDGIDEILRYISDNLNTDFSLSTLAERVHLSANYFVRKFKERMGISPMKYVARARLERAKTLLSGTSMRIGEVMARTGFDDAAYFSRSFKAVTGYSPRTFREMAKAESAD